MLAPIALYPDSLLAQVLMAATYPLEVVEADRWVRANKNLKGDQLNDALDKMEWDPSVKALAAFPQVVAMMSEKLEWMQKVGDAFLAQEEDVMDTVQKLRAKAEAAGNLKTTNEQKIVVEEKVIRIEPVSPEVVHVPVYNPVVVYGPWWNPAFLPFIYYPPGVVLAPGAFWWFGPRVFVGPVWSRWGHWDWHHHTVYVNINRNVIIAARTSGVPTSRRESGSTTQPIEKGSPTGMKGSDSFLANLQGDPWRAGESFEGLSQETGRPRRL